MSSSSNRCQCPWRPLRLGPIPSFAPTVFLGSPRAHFHTHSHTYTSLSPNHWSQIGAKYRRWGRDIGSCQMGRHYQPVTVRLLCSSIMTSRCTCLSARPAPHTGTRVRLNIAPLPLCLPPLHHSAPRPQTPHTHTPLFSISHLEQTRFSGQAGPKHLHHPSLISSPFIETRWHYSGQELPTRIYWHHRGGHSILSTRIKGAMSVCVSLSLASYKNLPIVEGHREADHFFPSHILNPWMYLLCYFWHFKLRIVKHIVMTNTFHYF